ncbi:MAG: hypothetical protein IJL91_06960 [Bacteroidales bacterium]|nr:hypothetical protein [Bacteroidales bacterium]
MQASYDGVGIQIYFDQSELDAIEHKLGALKNKKNTVLARAINRSLATARKIVKKETADYYDVSQSQVESGNGGKKGIKIQRATSGKPYATLGYDSPYTNIYKWKGRRLTVSPQTPHVGSSSKPKFYKSHAKRGKANEPLNQGRYKPFVQHGNKKKANALFVRTSQRRYPIMGLAGPAMSQGIKQPGVKEKIETQVMDTLAKRINHEIDALLKGYTS